MSTGERVHARARRFVARNGAQVMISQMPARRGRWVRCGSSVFMVVAVLSALLVGAVVPPAEATVVSSGTAVFGPCPVTPSAAWNDCSGSSRPA